MSSIKDIISRISVYKLRQYFGADKVSFDDKDNIINVDGIEFEIHEIPGMTALNALVIDRVLGYSKEVHEDDTARFSKGITDYICDIAMEYLEDGQYGKVESSQTVTAAESVGTVFYRVTEDAVKEAFHSDKGNIWMAAEFEINSWNCIDADKSLFGSVVIDDVLYLCVTDGQDISVAGDVVDPESALEDYDLEALTSYIQDADESIILKYITEYEIKFEDIDNTAIYLLNEDISFVEIVKAAEEIGLIDT